MSTDLKLVEQDLSGTLTAALEIAQRRADTLRQLREALERNDDALALSIARKVCGLNESKKMLRIVASKHGGPSSNR